MLKKLRFGGIFKVIEKYQEAGPYFIYISSTKIGHNQLKRYSNRKIQCVINTGIYKIKIHKCGVIKYIAKIKKRFTQVISKYINCKRN